MCTLKLYFPLRRLYWPRVSSLYYSSEISVLSAVSGAVLTGIQRMIIEDLFHKQDLCLYLTMGLQLLCTQLQHQLQR